MEESSESRLDMQRIAQIYQKILDKSAPHYEFRWMFFVFVFIVYVIRVWYGFIDYFMFYGCRTP